ncbi:hypothetical protein PUMCH_003430 [Australozyma saopauloensis]|uniref:Amino acid transporter transmembrane domain-containing protein n=1 Tax=Australozyma saopauloensis TaxID=291208 RepID=A0AAX4HED1_9ASCO|nr:hypothetical protein PUMCH_003430 [[Candida] saopauloensis]
MSAGGHNGEGGAARRQSFLDIGGPNSITNFASSLQRAHIYMEQAVNDGASMYEGQASGDLSPCTSPQPVLPYAGANGTSGKGASSYGSTAHSHRQGGGCSEQFRNFDFPHDEETAVAEPLHRTASRRESISSTVIGFGSSTAPQTIFNSVNTLMGIAMLSLPFAFRLTGWVLATVQLCLVAWVTSKTAKILGLILRKNKHLFSYGDIAYAYGGSKFHAFATFTFTLDLLGALLSLVLIFADSFSILFPRVNAVVFKLLIVAVTFVTSFLPLSTVSFISLFGVMCSGAVLVCVGICGFFSTKTPGSLLYPAATSLWPSSFLDILLSWGLFMAPWGGHPVFPELYRDMRHPRKYDMCCNSAFLFTFLLDYAIGAVGYLMFGADAKDSLTKNLMSNKAYPDWVSPACCTLLGLLLASKLALIVRPVITVAERLIPSKESEFITYKNGSRASESPVKAIFARIIVLSLVFVMSILFTSFGQIMAFFGSAICFTICVTLPLLFHMKFNKEEMSIYLRGLTAVGVVFGVIGAVGGTYAAVVETPS